MKSPKILIISGDGINCERETAWAFSLVGAETQIVHINEILKNSQLLESCQGIAFPGGFSFGDELGSGQLLAIKMKARLQDSLHRVVEKRIPMIGICNGLQVLTKLGLLADWNGERRVAMARNKQGHFIDRWVKMKVESDHCIWTKGLKDQMVDVPVRHGEGRFQFIPGRENEIYQDLTDQKQIVFRYTEDINGSYERIAGICDPTGTILGLMPHPEAVLYQVTTPQVSLTPFQETWSMKLFSNAITYIKEM